MKWQNKSTRSTNKKLSTYTMRERFVAKELSKSTKLISKPPTKILTVFTTEYAYIYTRIPLDAWVFFVFLCCDVL